MVAIALRKRLAISLFSGWSNTCSSSSKVDFEISIVNFSRLPLSLFRRCEFTERVLESVTVN